MEDEMLGKCSDEKDGTEIAHISDESTWKATERNHENILESTTPINDSDDKEVVVEAVETKPIDDPATVANFVSLVDIESSKITTQNISYAHNSKNG